MYEIRIKTVSYLDKLLRPAQNAQNFEEVCGNQKVFHTFF
jgi:hypothetical protein